MANTYTLIASNTLSSSAASVTFSSIPNTYTDLELRYAIRTDNASINESIVIEFNSNTNTVYSQTRLLGNSSTASSQRSSNQANTAAGPVTSANATSNTFGTGSLYIPSYTASQNKPISTFSEQENNSSTSNEAYIVTRAHLFASTAAISSIKFTSINAANFVSGSSFFLYGIKNS